MVPLAAGMRISPLLAGPRLPCAGPASRRPCPPASSLEANTLPLLAFPRAPLRFRELQRPPSSKRAVVRAAAGGDAGEGAGGGDIVFLEEEDRYYYKQLDNADGQLDVAAPSDFYELLGLELEADEGAVKAGYRKMQKICHPDIAGDAANAVSILLNSAYSTLSNASARALYDKELKEYRAEQGSPFTGRAISEWAGKDGEQRAIFVDETACIGCGQCVMAAENTFAIEDLYGRAQVKAQWSDEEWMIKDAVDMCPVDCIYYVQKRQLCADRARLQRALLEWVSLSCKREDIAIVRRRLSGNMGGAPSSESPFTKADNWLKGRKEADVTREAAGGAPRAHDQRLAAAVAKAWLSLPAEVRRDGWPSWMAETYSM